MWCALIAGTLIGCTDWVDGMLARKYGPTVLGGLLDPIADKVFIAFAYTPFADIGMVPWWACALMFTREFFITALRSAYEQRNLTLKTSYIAKAKTWTQMQGIGVHAAVPARREQADPASSVCSHRRGRRRSSRWRAAGSRKQEVLARRARDERLVRRADRSCALYDERARRARS